MNYEEEWKEFEIWWETTNIGESDSVGLAMKRAAFVAWKEAHRTFAEKLQQAEQRGREEAVEYLTTAGTLDFPKDMWLVRRIDLEAAKHSSSSKKI